MNCEFLVPGHPGLFLLVNDRAHSDLSVVVEIKIPVDLRQFHDTILTYSKTWRNWKLVRMDLSPHTGGYVGKIILSCGCDNTTLQRALREAKQLRNLLTKKIKSLCDSLSHS